ncbi:MAG: hypothetical protein COB02_16835 [Candidatus Cloacimonadota bacterium]|nr:MAG: hypothetical protein COB02_16835 [Candidatus Cloacimonadota bacterium]
MTGQSLELDNIEILKLISQSDFILWRVNQNGIITLSLGDGHHLIGLQEDELHLKNIFEFFSDSLVLVKYLNFALSGERFKAPIEIYGSIFDVSFYPTNNKKAEIYCVLVNITDHKRIELELRENESRYRRLSEASYEGVGIIQNGLIIDANRSLADMFGYRTYEILGLPTISMIEESSKSTILENLSSNYERPYHIKAIRKDGSIYDAEISHKLIPSENKNLKVIAVRDITERLLSEQAIKQKNRELEDINRTIKKQNLELEAAYLKIKQSKERNLKIENQLIQANKMISLGTLAAGIGHEISQPLNALKITIDGIEFWYQQGKSFDEKSLREKLKKASNHANRIAEIISQLRSLYNKKPREIKPTSINTLITKVLSTQKSTLDKEHIQFQLSLDENIPNALVNSIQFEQVIINLLNNSIYALSHSNTKDKCIKIKTTLANNVILLTFEDNGLGFKNSIKQIFDPFYSNKQGEGMGLGLSLIHTFISSWDGDIFASNSKNGGALFLISLKIDQS